MQTRCAHALSAERTVQKVDEIVMKIGLGGDKGQTHTLRLTASSLTGEYLRTFGVLEQDDPLTGPRLLILFPVGVLVECQASIGHLGPACEKQRTSLQNTHDAL